LNNIGHYITFAFSEKSAEIAAKLKIKSSGIEKNRCFLMSE